MLIEPEEWLGIVTRENKFFKRGIWVEGFVDEGLPVVQGVTTQTVNNKVVVTERNGLVFPKHLVRQYITMIRKGGLDA